MTVPVCLHLCLLRLLTKPPFYLDACNSISTFSSGTPVWNRISYAAWKTPPHVFTCVCVCVYTPPVDQFQRSDSTVVLTLLWSSCNDRHTVCSLNTVWPESIQRSVYSAGPEPSRPHSEQHNCCPPPALVRKPRSRVSYARMDVVCLCKRRGKCLKQGS